VVLGSSPSGPTLQSKVYDDKNIINLFSCKKNCKNLEEKKGRTRKKISYLDNIIGMRNKKRLGGIPSLFCIFRRIYIEFKPNYEVLVLSLLKHIAMLHHIDSPLPKLLLYLIQMNQKHIVMLYHFEPPLPKLLLYLILKI
jgi:hypothetical protein